MGVGDNVSTPNDAEVNPLAELRRLLTRLIEEIESPKNAGYWWRTKLDRYCVYMKPKWKRIGIKPPIELVGTFHRIYLPNVYGAEFIDRGVVRLLDPDTPSGSVIILESSTQDEIYVASTEADYTPSFDASV